MDGQKEAHVERILAHRVRMVGGKEVEEWKVRWTGYSKAHDQWRTSDKLERGGPLQPLQDFEAARLSMEAQVRDEADRRREQRSQRAAQAGVTFAHLPVNPCDEMYLLEDLGNAPLPRDDVQEEVDNTADKVPIAQVVAIIRSNSLRILVLFSGTGSVEREFLRCHPTASVVTLDSSPLWQPTHQVDIMLWDYEQYPPGHFDVVWASPPCT